MDTVFFGTPDFAVASLEALHERTRVVAVVCQPDRPAGRGMQPRPPPVKRRALELGLEVLQPTRLREPGFRARLEALAPELAVVAAYGKILPASMLEAVPRGYVNVHASLLPRLRGAAPIHRAVLEGDARSGVAIMQLTAGLDEGPVYLARETPLAPDETAGSLHDRLARLGAEALGEFLDAILAGGPLEAREQDHAAASYAPKLEAHEFRLDWNQPAPRVDRQIRGLSPFPGAWTELAGKRLLILGSRPVAGGVPPDPGGGRPATPAPGAVLELRPEGPVVACGSGSVLLTRVKPAGKRAMAAGDWLRGARLEPGVRLGQG